MNNNIIKNDINNNIINKNILNSLFNNLKNMDLIKAGLANDNRVKIT